MSNKRDKLEADLAEKMERRALYIEREKVMLTNGVQSYGTGSRNLTRYNTDLAQIRAAIDQLSAEIEEIESELENNPKRKRFGLVFREW